MRVKRGVTAHAKHKKVLKAAKGYFGRRKNTIRAAKAAVDKAMQYAYRDRKNRKREFRALWIQRINAAAREHGLTYSRFISALATAGIDVDRKVLSELAITERAAFFRRRRRALRRRPESRSCPTSPPCNRKRSPRSSPLPMRLRSRACGSRHSARKARSRRCLRLSASCRPT